MAGINKVQVMGRLGKDPEIRTFQDGGKVCNLSIATSETWKDKTTGEKKERSEWHRVSIFAPGLVKLVEQYARKGKRIMVTGQLETRKWQDQSGNDRYSTEIVLRPFKGEVEIIDWPDDGDKGPHSGGQSDNGNNSGYSAPGNTGEIDDEIPF